MLHLLHKNKGRTANFILHKINWFLLYFCFLSQKRVIPSIDTRRRNYSRILTPAGDIS